jgi:hypothetical protein
MPSSLGSIPVTGELEALIHRRVEEPGSTNAIRRASLVGRRRIRRSLQLGPPSGLPSSKTRLAVRDKAAIRFWYTPQNGAIVRINRHDDHAVGSHVANGVSDVPRQVCRLRRLFTVDPPRLQAC